MTDWKSAYQIIITPPTEEESTGADIKDRYEAEYTEIKGGATIEYDSSIPGKSGTGYVAGFHNAGASVRFIINVPEDGYYNLYLRYSAETDGTINFAAEKYEKEISYPATDGVWNSICTQVYLQASINSIVYKSTGSDIKIDCLDVSVGEGTIAIYEAEDGILSGTAKIIDDTNASGGKAATDIGVGDENSLTFRVNVKTKGKYRMTVRFSSAERGVGAGGEYDLVERYAKILVNGKLQKEVYFRNTYDWSIYRTTVIDLELEEGDNTITFINDRTYARLTLATIPTKPEEVFPVEELAWFEEQQEYTYDTTRWYEFPVNCPYPVRIITYYAPPGSYGNIAEIEFYTKNEQGEDVKVDLTNATLFGTIGVWGNKNAIGYPKAFDGYTTTFWDAYQGDNQYCGVDLGEGNEVVISKIRVFPRPTNLYCSSRIKGGYFVGETEKSQDNYGFAPIIDKISIAAAESDAPIKVRDISIIGEGGTKTITANGEPLQMIAIINPVNATQKEVIWSIAGGTAVAAINPETGVLTATAPGIVTVKAALKDDPTIFGTLDVIVIQSEGAGQADKFERWVVSKEAGPGEIHKYFENAKVKMTIDTEKEIFDGEISVRRYNDETERPLPNDKVNIGIFLELLRSSNLDGIPVRIEVEYDPEELPDGLDESKLKIYRYNDETEMWDLVAHQGVDVDRNIVWAVLDHFSIFGIFADISEPDEPGGEPGEEEPGEGEPDDLVQTGSWLDIRILLLVGFIFFAVGAGVLLICRKKLIKHKC